MFNEMNRTIYQNINGMKILHFNPNLVTLAITKLGDLYVCEDYVNITAVLNVSLNEQSTMSKYQTNENTVFNSKSSKNLFFQC